MVEIERQKKIVFSIIDDVFKRNEFKLVKGKPIKYVKKNDGIIYSMTFDFSSKTKNSFASNSMMGISINIVEKVILEIGLPNWELDI